MIILKNVGKTLSRILVLITTMTNNNLVNAEPMITSNQENSTNNLLWTSTHNIHPKIPDLVFKFLGKDQVARIQIYKGNETNPFQIIQQRDFLKFLQQANFKVEDVNVDGYQDIYFMIEPPTGFLPYSFWFFNPTTKVFVESLELHRMTVPKIDAEPQQIQSYQQSGCCINHIDYYQFISEKPVLFRQEIEEHDVVTIRTLKKRVGENMQLFEQQASWSIIGTIHPNLPAFEFKLIGQRLKIKDSEQWVNVQEIQITKDKEASPFQKLQVLDMKTSLAALASTEKNLQVQDINFDGYQDINLRASLPAGLHPYQYWLFDHKNEIFVEIPEFRRRQLKLDAANRRLISPFKNGNFIQDTDYYQFVDLKPIIYRQESQIYVSENIRQLTVKERVGDEMKVVEQKMVKENHVHTKIPKFADFEVKNVYQGQPAVVEPPAESTDWRFVEALEYWVPQGPNFAGTYTVVTWGCGTLCQAFAIVNAQTGTLFQPKEVSEVGLKFQINSRLLIINPPNDIKEMYGDNAPDWLHSRYYLWEDEQLKLIDPSIEIKVAAVDTETETSVNADLKAKNNAEVKAAATEETTKVENTENETKTKNNSEEKINPESQNCGMHVSMIHPKLPDFIFKLNGQCAEEPLENIDIKTIEVYRSDANQLLQQILVPDMKLQFHAQGVKEFKIEDINFDGYQDIRLIPLTYEVNFYTPCWLFEPKKGFFVRCSSEIETIVSPEFDVENKQIISLQKDSATHNTTSYYHFVQGKPQLYRQESREYSKEGVYQLTILELIEGEMTIVEQKWVQEEEINAETRMSDVANLIKEIWQNLDKTKKPCSDDTLSYFIEGRNLLNFYCHIKTNFIGYNKLSELVGLPVFIKGPHTENQLNLNNKYYFGYYNPFFVTWLKNNLIPAAQEPAFRELTQPFFDKYVQKLARTFYLVHELLFDDPDYLKQEQSAYLELVNHRQLPYGYSLKYKNFKNLSEKGYLEFDIATAVSFWIRRIIDGTENEFFSGLKLLMTTYDSSFALKHAQQTPLWTYQSPIHTQPPTFTFKLIGEPSQDDELPEGIHRVKQLEIYKNNDIYPFQTIQGVDMRIISEDEGFETEDMNFDTYQDFRIAGPNMSYLYWLFDPQTQVFVRNQQLEQIELLYGPPEFDAVQQQIKLLWRNGPETDWEAGIHGISEYKFIDEKLVLVRQELYQTFWEISEEENTLGELEPVQEFTIVTILEPGGITKEEMRVIEQKLVQGNLVQEKFGAEYETIGDELEIADPKPTEETSTVTPIN